MAPTTRRNSSGQNLPTNAQKIKDQEAKIQALEKLLADSKKASSQGKTSEYSSSGPKKQSTAPKKRQCAPIVQSRSGEQKTVQQHTKQVVWKERGFVNNETGRDEVFAQMLRETDLGAAYNFEGLSEEDQMALIKAFATTYERDLISTLNDKRSALGTQLKNAVKVHMDKKTDNFFPCGADGDGDLVLDVPRLVNIVLRVHLILPQNDDEARQIAEKAGIPVQEVPKYVDENQQFFRLWWDKLVPRTAGQRCWGESKRCHGLLSTHSPSPEDKPYVSSAHDAMTYISIVNGFPAWVKGWKTKEDRAKIEEEIKKNAPEGNAFAAKYSTKWSLTDGGHSRFGGFSKEGRQKFAQIRSAIGR